MKSSCLLLTMAPWILMSIGCQSQKARLTTQDVLTYLDGRPLVLPENVVTEKPVEVQSGDKVLKTVITGQPVTMTTRTVIMNRANISALSLGEATAVSDVAWATPVTFLYQDGTNMSAVEAVVEHSVSKGQILFLGFQVRKVAKQ